jgi:hypothetical protein
VVTDVETRLDRHLDLALGGMLLGRGSEELLASHAIEPGEVPQLLANLRHARRDELAIDRHRSVPAAAC